MGTSAAKSGNTREMSLWLPGGISALKYPKCQAPTSQLQDLQGGECRLSWVGCFFFIFLLFSFFFPWLSHLPSLSIFNQLSQPWFQCLRSGKVIPLHQQGTAHTSPLCAAPQPTQFCTVTRVSLPRYHFNTFLPLWRWA